MSTKGVKVAKARWWNKWSRGYGSSLHRHIVETQRFPLPRQWLKKVWQLKYSNTVFQWWKGNGYYATATSICKGQMYVNIVHWFKRKMYSFAREYYMRMHWANWHGVVGTAGIISCCIHLSWQRASEGIGTACHAWFNLVVFHWVSHRWQVQSE